MCNQNATNFAHIRSAESYAEDHVDAGTPFPGIFNILKQSAEANWKVAHTLSSLGCRLFPRHYVRKCRA